MFTWKKNTGETPLIRTPKVSQRDAFTPRWMFAALLALLAVVFFGFHASVGTASETSWIRADQLANPDPTGWDLYDYGMMDLELFESVVFGSKVIFTADSDTHGREPWVTDGTADGTQRLKDIKSGTSGSYPQNYVVLGDVVLFRADDGTNGSELWVTDGTEGGTSLVKDIQPGSTSGYPNSGSPNGFAVLGDQAFFSANDGTNGRELWVTDGTEGGTSLVKDIKPGSSGGDPYFFTPFGDVVLFRADDGTNGYELWVTDGTEGGTSLVKDIQPGSNGSYPRGFAVLGDQAFFRADDGTNGYELWVTDGTEGGTSLVKDINSGSSGSNPDTLVVVPGGFVIFGADNGTFRALWASDGTPSNTELISVEGENFGVPTNEPYESDNRFPLVDNKLIVNAGSDGSTSAIWALTVGQRVEYFTNCEDDPGHDLEDTFAIDGDAVIQRSVSCGGFYFTGWNTAADGSGTSYSQGQRVTLTDTLLLYAQWAPEPVVHFDANGGSFPGAAPELSGQPDAYVVVPSNQPVRDDHFFLGWRASNDDGELLVTSGYSFQLPSTSGTTTFYAQWARAVTVDFSANGGSGVPEPVRGQELTVTALPSEAPTRTGFSFAGWQTTQDGSGNRYQPGEPFLIPTSDTTLYASWTLAGGSPSSAHPFTDVGDGSYYSEHVGTLYQHGITIGVTPSTYGPAQLVTRGQMAAFLARTYEVTTGSACIGSHPFTDVTDNTYFAHDVGCLYSLGVTVGTSPTTFSPDRELNRGEMAAFLGRMIDAVNGGSCSGTHSFVDVSQASFYADAVGCLKANNITTGTSASHYSPHLAVDRGQMAAFLARLMAVLD